MAALPSTIAHAWLRCGIRVDGAGVHRGGGDRSHRRSAADVYRFYHVLAGRVSGDFGGGPISAGPGTGLILPPQRGFLERDEDLGAGVAVLIALFQVAVPPGGTNPLPWLRLPAVVAAADPGAAAALCARMEAAGPPWSADAGIRVALRPLLDQLLTAHLADGFAAGAWEQRPPMPAWLNDLRGRASRRLCDPQLRPDNLHRLAGRSREHVTRALSAHLGVGAAGFLRQLRIELAARLLSQGGDVSIAEICERVGYRDHSLFCRHFRARLGVTPTAWRSAAAEGRGTR